MTTKNKVLTPTQEDILGFIASTIYKSGYQPSYREICKKFGFRSPAAVTNHLKACEKKGACKRRPGCRSLEFSWREYL
jgi:SOS-response transcriptional repressor LexA